MKIANLEVDWNEITSNASQIKVPIISKNILIFTSKTFIDTNFK